MTDAEIYALKCKHYGAEGQCYKRSAKMSINCGTHVMMKCDMSCKRMQNFNNNKIKD